MKAGGKWFQGVIRGVVVAGLTALLLACGSDSPEKLMSSAKDYLAKGDSKAAVIQLRNLVGKAPNNGEARLLLGQAFLSEGEYVQAEKELRRALDLFQPPDQALPPYAQALLAQGKYKELVAEIPGYKLSSPAAIAAVRTSLGDAQQRLGNIPRAKDAYAAALAAVPGYPRARLGEAILVGSEGRLDEALKAVDDVIAADPKLAEAQSLRADILLAKGDREGSRKALEAAIATDGRYLPARLSLIGLLTDARDFDAATRLVESTRKLAPQDLRFTYLEAVLAFRKGDLEKARQLTQQILKYLPEHVPTLVLAGAVELQDKKLAAAEPQLRKAVSKAPNHAGARQLLVQTYLRMGQPAKALEALQPLVEKGMPTSPQLLLLAGETYLASGDAKTASVYYQAASSAGQAQGAAAKTRLGQIALASGRPEEGFKELEAASELDAGQYQADLAIIAGHLRRNEVDKAMAAVKSLEKKQPNNPLTFQMYGIAYLAKRDAQAARRSFEKALELQPNYLPAAFNLAQLDITAKRPDDARRRYEAMIAKDNKNEQLYLALADLQARTQTEPKAIGETLQRAVSANPQSVPARLALIEFHLRNKANNAALTAAQSAVAALPNDPRVLEATGLALEAAGETAQAIESYTKLAALLPSSPQPLLRLAGLYARQKATIKAIDALRRAQKLMPNARDLSPQIAQVYLAGNEPEEALKEARALQKADPKFAGGYVLEGDVLVAQRKFPQAEKAYREALKLEPKADAVAIRLHRALAEGGKHAEADVFAQKWIAEHPRNPSMRIYLGERELTAKNYKAAATHYQAVISVDSNNAVALNNLAWIGGELGDPKALGYAEQAVKVAPNNAAILDTYGMLLVKKGNAQQALEYLRRARELAPGRYDLGLNYARALAQAGDKVQARRELEALQAVPDDFPGKSQIPAMIQAL